VSSHDVVLFLELKERVGRLETMIEALQASKDLRAEIAMLKMRIGGLQGQLNALRQGRPPDPETLPDAPANTHGEADAATG